MREPKNQMLGTMQPPLMQLSAKEVLHNILSLYPNQKVGSLKVFPLRTRVPQVSNYHATNAMVNGVYKRTTSF